MLPPLALCSLLTILAACSRQSDVELLSTDVHISIAQHPLVLPFAAVGNYTYEKQTFSLHRKDERERAGPVLKQFLQDTADPAKPLILDGVTVVISTYGSTGVDSSLTPVCSLLTREWARSVCNEAWAALRQALPPDNFRLVDLSRLQIGAPGDPTNCRDEGKDARPLPQSDNESVMLCHPPVRGDHVDEVYTAVLRIEGNLGAVWSVWGNGQNLERAEAMTEREGEAIAAFVQYGIGPRENFAELHEVTCRLRRPPVQGPFWFDSNPHPDPNPDCDDADLPQ